MRNVGASLILLIVAVAGAGCTSTVSGQGRESSSSVSVGPSSSVDFPSSSVSASTPKPSEQPMSPTQLIGKFTGRWFGHDRGLIVRDGIGEVSYRVFKFCTVDPTPPCNEMQNNEIIDGGRIAFRLNDAYPAGNATIATGTIVASTVPDLPVGMQLTARVQDFRLSLSLFSRAPFCAFDAPARVAATCGA
ncbi:MAG TPA: hypothetical protein VGN33_16265 [Leifsonia sp.]|jgi:hypothetical protein|nr:hypothetical protein [Leifsonia sp.]